MSIMTRDKYAENYVRIGLLSMVAFTILIVVSLRPIRARNYEIFYFTHFSMLLYVPCDMLTLRSPG